MKTKISLEILQILNPAKNHKLKSVVSKPTDGLLFLVPTNPALNSFFFRIIKKSATQISGAKIKYVIQYKPEDRSEINASTRTVDIDLIDKLLNDWLEILEEYVTVETIFDDPFIKKYQSDFQEKLKILDDDAGFAPFDLERQLFLMEYLDSIIEKSEESKTEENKEDINQIVQESTNLKNDLTKETKKEVISKLSKILARVQKTGIKLISEIFIKTAAEISTKLLLGN